jgi:hypothetical protein
MATVLECSTEEQRSVVPVHCGKCLSGKAVHNLVEKFSQRRSKVADDTRPGAEMIETTVKSLLCCEFRRTGKAMGQMYQCWWRLRRKINVFFFQVQISNVLRFISNCDLFTEAPSYSFYLKHSR